MPDPHFSPPQRGWHGSESRGTPQRWRCVAFDFDGTLVDSLPALRRAYEVFLNRFGLTGSDAEFERLNGPNMTRIVALLKKWHDLSAPHEELLRHYTANVEEGYRERARPADGADELLHGTQAAGLGRALVTSSPRRAVEPVLDRFHWRSCFEVVVYGDEVPVAKPDPAVYRLACERGGWVPGECVAVEDAPAGIQAAVVAGLTVIGVGPPERQPVLRAAGATWTCTTLRQVYTIVAL